MLCSLTLLVLGIVVVVVAYHAGSWALSRMRVGGYNSKHVLITGCDTGFGHMLTKRLDGLGFYVFAACLTSSGQKNLQASCSERVTTLHLDVTDEKSIKDARDFVESRLPVNAGLWGVVNNAGVRGAPVPSEWLTRQDFLSCFSVNLFGLIDVTQAFLPLVRRSRGRIVNMASTLGRIALTPAAYCVSKYGVEAFSDCLRREVYRQGIKVCVLEPGYFKTDILSLQDSTDQFRKWYDITPLEIRQHYPDLTPETFPRMVQKVREKSSDRLDLVVDAYELALTSRFPPTRQLIGWDVRLFYRLLWNLPDAVTDWVLNLLRTLAVKS